MNALSFIWVGFVCVMKWGQQQGPSKTMQSLKSEQFCIRKFPDVKLRYGMWHPKETKFSVPLQAWLFCGRALALCGLTSSCSGKEKGFAMNKYVD